MLKSSPAWAPLAFLAKLILLLGCAQIAHAENFIEIYRSESLNSVTSLDIDSPKFDLAKGGVVFKYRSTRSDGGATVEYTALARCSQMSMWVLRADGIRPSYRFAVGEYYKDGQGWVGSPYIVNAYFHEDIGKLIAAACDIGQPEVMGEVFQPVSRADCIGPRDSYTKVLCQSSNAMRGNLVLLRQRISAVGQRCGNTVQLNKYFSDRLERLTKCFGAESCIRHNISDLAYAVNDDVHEIDKWGSSESPQPFPTETACNAEEKVKKSDIGRQKRAEQTQAVSKTTEAFLGCARNNVSKLDDKRSDATVVARVIYRVCDQEFYSVVDAKSARDGKADTEAVRADLEDNLLEMVLQNRVRRGAN